IHPRCTSNPAVLWETALALVGAEGLPFRGGGLRVGMSLPDDRQPAKHFDAMQNFFANCFFQNDC
ncbi:MAG TPA: hypothetical protein VE978_19285, partial [Chitinophagales bacterium]|nr:hypothetical protein [Chitinophagales bacterium]